MTRYRRKTGSRQGAQRGVDALRDKGISAVVLGLFFLLTPVFLGSSQILSPLSSALRIPGWMALGIGLLLLGLHAVIRRKEPASSQPSVNAQAAHQAPPGRSGTSSSTARHKSNKTAEKVSAAAMASRPTHGAPPAITPTAWSPAVFAAIEWRRFEAVCETLFAQAGFITKSQSHGADGGVDIWLHSANATGPVAIAQCKHWNRKSVGVKDMREFFGVMASHQLKRGTYATSSTYTADATAFALANGINALDGAGLLRLIATRTPEQQQALLAVAFEGDYGRPTCASCGIKMVECPGPKGRTDFWGCKNHPRCRSTLPMSAAAR